MQFLFSIFISIIVLRFSIYNLEIGSLKLFLKLDRNGNIIYIVRISWYCSGFPIPHKRTKLQRFRPCGSDGFYQQSRGGLQSIIQTVDLQLPFYTSIIIYLYFLIGSWDYNRRRSVPNKQYSPWTLEVKLYGYILFCKDILYYLDH